MLFALLGYATIFIAMVVSIIDIKMSGMEEYIKPGYQPENNVDKDTELKPPVGGSSMQNE